MARVPARFKRIKKAAKKFSAVRRRGVVVRLVRRPKRRNLRSVANSRLISSMSGLVSNSSMSYGRGGKISSKLTALGAKSNYVNNVVDQRIPGSALSGKQDCIILGRWNSVADIFNTALSVPYTTGTGSGSKSPTLFHLHGVSVEMTLQNPTSVTQIVDLYDIIAKKDIPGSSLFTALGTNVYDPVSAWVSGMFNQNTGSSSAPTPDPINFLGAKPTDSQLFNDYYKIVKKTSLVMQQNSTHVHKVNVNIGRTFDLNLIKTQQVYLEGLSGLSLWSMAVMRGIPVDSGTETTTTIAPSLRWVYSENYTYSWLQANGRQWTHGEFITPIQNNVLQALQLNNPTLGVVVTA